MLKLLIVDDEKFTREGIIENLPWKDLGIGLIEQAEDGKAGLDLAAGYNPDIILSDVRMPGMDGIEMAYGIKAIYPQCKIIFMSGYSDKEYLKSAIDLKAISYVEKPIILDELKTAIENAVSLCLEEERKKTEETEIKQTLDAGVSMLKGEIAIKLADSHSELDSILQLIKITGMEDLLQPTYLTILIRTMFFEDSTVEQVNSLRQKICNIIHTELAHSELSGIYAYKDHDYLILHLYGKFPSMDVFKNRVRDFCRKISASFNGLFNCFISIGSIVNGIQNVPESYQAAVLTDQRAFFHDYGAILFYDSRHSDISGVINDDSLKIFFDLIMQNKKEQAIKHIKNMSFEFRKHQDPHPRIIKDFFEKLLFQLVKAGEENNITFGWESFHNCNTLDEVVSFLLGKLEEYFMAIDAKKAGMDPVENIMSYIHANYTKENLSIKEISQSTCLSSNYMCALFKEKTNKTINQYITEYRIDKAKRLLMDKQLILDDIAAKVGYADGSYFRKVFKKVTGITPSVYRKREH